MVYDFKDKSSQELLSRLGSEDTPEIFLVDVTDLWHVPKKYVSLVWLLSSRGLTKGEANQRDKCRRPVLRRNTKTLPIKEAWTHGWTPVVIFDNL